MLNITLNFWANFWFHINPGNSKYAKFGNNRGQKFFLCCKKMWLVYGNMDSVSIGTWSLGVLPILCTCFTLHFTIVCLDWNLESLVFIFKPRTHFFKSFFKILKFLHVCLYLGSKIVFTRIKNSIFLRLDTFLMF